MVRGYSNGVYEIRANRRFRRKPGGIEAIIQGHGDLSLKVVIQDQQ